jgi:hypothetical protein
VDTIPCLSYRGTTFDKNDHYPLLGELMLCTYMADCEYELFQYESFWVSEHGGLGEIMVVVLIMIVLFLKSLYNYRDIIHPLLFHLYRQLLRYKSYIIPSQTIPKEGER